MQTRTIGSLKTSTVGLGCNNFGWTLDAEASCRVIQAAIEAGITFFDTADVYGDTDSETFLGQALASQRDRAVIATKFGLKSGRVPGGAGAGYVRSAVENSLRRLRTDRIDLYQLHVPDPETPISETLEALAKLVAEGKVLEIGCSNFSPGQLKAAYDAGVDIGITFSSLQHRYNLLERGAEEELLPECERQGLAFLPYFPLASGLLTGKYRRDRPPPSGSRLATLGEGWAKGAQQFASEDFKTVDRLGAYAADHGRSLVDLAISWLLSHRSIAAVIAGATSPAQVQANAKAGAWVLNERQCREIEALLQSEGG